MSYYSIEYPPTQGRKQTMTSSTLLPLPFFLLPGSSIVPRTGPVFWLTEEQPLHILVSPMVYGPVLM
jgi:hypothetical protein